MKRTFTFLLLAAFAANVFAQGNVLKNADPVSAKFSPERLKRIDAMIEQNIDSGYVKGAVGFIARDGKIVYN